ncbi:MAG: hypothetical protein OIF50_01360, partial [Flavobacteriaceae bacterium]|nr:hypothetical protein [Flavobacteriaceae bacterium]
MARLRYVKGNYIKIIGGDYDVWATGNINLYSAKKLYIEAEEGIVLGTEWTEPPEANIQLPKPDLKGHIIFCNGYLSNPRKNFESYINVFQGRNPDNLHDKPWRGWNMNEKTITDEDDIYTNTELSLDQRQGAEAFNTESRKDKYKFVQEAFPDVQKFYYYWHNQFNISGKSVAKVLTEYFHAEGRDFYVNGSHGLESSGEHRVLHGVAQGYAWAKRHWGICSGHITDSRAKSKTGAPVYGPKSFEQRAEENPYLKTKSPAFRPVTLVGHSQGAAVAAGFVVGIMRYAQEMGWKEIPINLIFLGTHQPQGLTAEEYTEFLKLHNQDVLNDWFLEWGIGLFSKNIFHHEKGIDETMQDLLGSKDWGGLKKRAVQFTFPNDRALFVMRMGDIEGVKNACSPKSDTSLLGWQYSKSGIENNDQIEEDGFAFPKRILDKAFGPDGNYIPGKPTYKETVRAYWKAYKAYKVYRKKVENDPKMRYYPSKELIPPLDVLPDFVQKILQEGIRRLEGAKYQLYMQSELFRLRLEAFIAFTHKHEMELQAHFAPVGLMMNKGTLSDWDKYKDQTIWERIQETAKDIFFHVDLPPKVSPIEKMDILTSYAEEEGKNKIVKTASTNNSLVDEWVGIAKKELFVKDTWANDLMQWAKGNKYYKGSG